MAKLSVNIEEACQYPGCGRGPDNYKHRIASTSLEYHQFLRSPVSDSQKLYDDSGEIKAITVDAPANQHADKLDKSKRISPWAIITSVTFLIVSLCGGAGVLLLAFAFLRYCFWMAFGKHLW